MNHDEISVEDFGKRYELQIDLAIQALQQKIREAYQRAMQSHMSKPYIAIKTTGYERQDSVLHKAIHPLEEAGWHFHSGEILYMSHDRNLLPTPQHK